MYMRQRPTERVSGIIIMAVQGHRRIRLDEEKKKDGLYCRLISYCMVHVNAQVCQKKTQHIYCMAVESAVHISKMGCNRIWRQAHDLNPPPSSLHYTHLLPLIKTRFKIGHEIMVSINAYGTAHPRVH